MLPTINEFVSKYGLENFVVVADSGLMNNANIAELEAHGYKYIIGAKIKNESQEVKNWIQEQPKRDCQMVGYDKGCGRRLLVGYTDDHAKKDAYNREKGIRRLEKAYEFFTLHSSFFTYLLLVLHFLSPPSSLTFIHLSSFFP